MADYEIAAVSTELRQEVQEMINAKTKPLGSLGQIENLALNMALSQNTAEPGARTTLLLCAGDHGIVEEGVSAWPSEVTAQMVLNFLSGGAAANVFARSAGAVIKIIDAGVSSPLPDDKRLLRAGIRAGTRNMLKEDAMTAEEVDAALSFGGKCAAEAVANGADVIALGEMGIGNTSSAALLAHIVTGATLENLVGAGAGLDTTGVVKKIEVLKACRARKPKKLNPLEAMAAFGGLEIAVMAGAVIGAAASHATVLVDGYIATAAALMAVEARPECRPYLVFAHESFESGHVDMLSHLDADALLDLDLRLGEGTGALLAAPLMKAAAAMLAEMATFKSAGVTDSGA